MDEISRDEDVQYSEKAERVSRPHHAGVRTTGVPLDETVLHAWMHGCMGCMAAWMHGCMAAWMHGNEGRLGKMIKVRREFDPADEWMYGVHVRSTSTGPEEDGWMYSTQVRMYGCADARKDGGADVRMYG